MKGSLSGLWKNPDFIKLWAGQTVSLFGSQISVLALPLLAANVLQATPQQMGILGFVQYVPWLLVGLFAGIWVDRLPRRPILLTADIQQLMVEPFSVTAHSRAKRCAKRTSNCRS